MLDLASTLAADVEVFDATRTVSLTRYSEGAQAPGASLRRGSGTEAVYSVRAIVGNLTREERLSAESRHGVAYASRLIAYRVPKTDALEGNEPAVGWYVTDEARRFVVVSVQRMLLEQMYRLVCEAV